MIIIDALRDVEAIRADWALYMSHAAPDAVPPREWHHAEKRLASDSGPLLGALAVRDAKIAAAQAELDKPAMEVPLSERIRAALSSVSTSPTPETCAYCGGDHDLSVCAAACEASERRVCEHPEHVDDRDREAELAADLALPPSPTEDEPSAKHDHDPLDIAWSATDQPRVVAHFPCGDETAYAVGARRTARQASQEHRELYDRLSAASPSTSPEQDEQRPGHVRPTPQADRRAAELGGS